MQAYCFLLYFLFVTVIISSEMVAYLSVDLPHLQFSANRLTRGMSKPTTGSWN